MANYRYVVIVFRDGRRDKLVVQESDTYPELVALRRLYGIRYKVGRRLPPGQAVVYDAIESQSTVSRKGAKPARPLSPEFGRGSGGPI